MPQDSNSVGQTQESLFGGGMPLRDALEKMRIRLLDLTARNRLLNFKTGAGKALAFVDISIDEFYTKLVENGNKLTVTPVPAPTRVEWEMKNGRHVRPDIKSHAASLGIDASLELPPPGMASSTIPRALYYPDDLERHLRKLSREAKSAIEETGANVLFLVVGLLEYPDRENSERILNAPLVAIPVHLDRSVLDGQTGHYRYVLGYTGEDIEDNLSLREKLRADWSLELPEIGELDAIEPYLKSVSRVIRDKPGWAVKRQMMLALLSFSKMLLVKDLDESKWPLNENGDSTLLEHPLLTSIVSGTIGEHDYVERVDEYDIDEHPNADVPFIYDCDSSQHSALIDAISGRNMVIHGPPGTGKSQTITNLIAASIADGKRVLFVAEKLAALQVVRERLEQAGLGDFCLELHSNKSNKKRVLEDVERRLGQRYSEPPGLPEQIRALEEKKKELKRYVELMNSIVGNAQGLTVNQVMWRSERFRQDIGEDWRAVRELQVKQADELTGAEFRSFQSVLKQLAAEYESARPVGTGHPFWGLYPTELPPGGEVSIERILLSNLPKLEEFSLLNQRVADFLGDAGFAATAAQAQKYLVDLAGIGIPTEADVAFECLPKLFGDENSGGQALACIKAFSTMLDAARKIEAQMKLRLRASCQTGKNDEVLVRESHHLLAGLGLADIPLGDLAEVAATLNVTAKRGENAVASLVRLGTEIGIPFNGTHVSLSQIEAAMEISTSAPRDLLHLRHNGLLRPDADQISSRASAQLSAIRNSGKNLAERLYMDLLPTQVELGIAIRVLRDGDQWWRIFQSQYREAVALHRRISRSRDKQTPSNRLDNLKALLEYQTACTKWETDGEYKAVFGALHAGLDTRLEDVARLVKWCTKSRQQAVAVGLNLDTFDYMSANEQVFARNSSRPESFSNAVAAVREAEMGLLAIARNSPLLSARFNDEVSLAERLKIFSSIASDVYQAHSALQTCGREDATASQVVQALGAQLALPHAIANLENNAEARALLGVRYKRADTDLEPVRAAFVFGREVLKQNLPPSLVRALLTHASVDNLQKLSQLLRAIELGWEAVDTFAEQMEACGHFDVEEWCGLKFGEAGFIQKLVSQTEAAIPQTGKLLSWVQYLQAVSRAKDTGLGEFAKLLENGSLRHTSLTAAYGYRFYATITERLFKEFAHVLGWFSGEKHQTVRNEFAELDRDIRNLRGRQCAARAAAKGRPVAGQTGVRVDDRTEMHLLRHVFPQVRPRMSIRKLLLRAGQSIQALKPCFLMGPQAVAQFLDPRGIKFDLVVMDEASQLKPEDALGAAVRGTQLVVVGDPNQLPPTGFWDKLGETPDDESQQAAALELESILDICKGQFHPVRYLRWHYRSQHQSLIAFSNKRFYNGDLVVFPSPYKSSRRLGVRFVHIADAEYENQRNEKEAWRVTDAVIHHMVHHPEESLGVVTLNLKQRELIESILDERLKSIAEAETYRTAWAENGMDFFVKNLENVQGDERDVIFISTTFGKARNTSVVRQNFGPISRADGWRRLNVLFTRAKRSMHVFSSMVPEDIVSDSTTPRGTRELRAYLEYARNGILEDSSPTNAEPDSDFEVSVAQTLTNAGYVCVPQLGVAGYRIDIAVRHPRFAQAYLAAIECDGATYHSGKSVRDRDRIRQEIIESLGWQDRIWRIWSTDWFRHPDRESARLLNWLKKVEQLPMDDALVVEDDVPETSVAEMSDSVRQTLPTTIVDESDENEELEVSVGDTVTYAPKAATHEETKVHISAGRSNLVEGMIWEGTPLAQTLLGAMAGEEVVLRVPGQQPRNLVIHEIVRPRTSTTVQ